MLPSGLVSTGGTTHCWDTDTLIGGESQRLLLDYRQGWARCAVPPTPCDRLAMQCPNRNVVYRAAFNSIQLVEILKSSSHSPLCGLHPKVLRASCGAAKYRRGFCLRSSQLFTSILLPKSVFHPHILLWPWLHRSRLVNWNYLSIYFLHLSCLYLLLLTFNWKFTAFILCPENVSAAFCAAEALRTITVQSPGPSVEFYLRRLTVNL